MGNITKLPIANDRASIPTSQESRERLAKLADDAAEGRKLTRELILAGRPENVIRAALEAMRSSLGPATRKEIATHVGVLALVFPQQAVTEDQAALRFRVLCDDLGDMTELALAEACRRYRTEPSKDGKPKFFPQAWQLLELAREPMRDVRARRRGIDRLEQMLDGRAADDEEPVVTIDAARMGEMLEPLNNRGRCA